MSQLKIKVGDKVRSLIIDEVGEILSIEGGYIQIYHRFFITSIRQDWFFDEYEKA